MERSELAELPAMLTVSEAARVLRISRPHAYAQIRAGTIPSVKLGGKIMVSRRELAALLGEEPETAEPWTDLEAEIRLLRRRMERAALILAGEG